MAKVESLLTQTRALENQLAQAEQERVALNKSALHHLTAAPTPSEAQDRWHFIAPNFELLYRDPTTVKALKQTILQLAVQGKLVPQDPADEPASRLLERIAAEKARLLEAGKIRKSKPLPPVGEDEIPFKVPEGWMWVMMGHLGNIMGGLTKNSKRRALMMKMPYLRVANVYANELRLDDVQEVGITEKELERVLLSEGDLLVVEGNGSIGQIGRVAIWDGSIEPCVHQNHIIKVRFYAHGLEKFLLYWLLAPGGRKEITRVASTTTGLHTLSLSKVSKFSIPLPPSPSKNALWKRWSRCWGCVMRCKRIWCRGKWSGRGCWLRCGRGWWLAREVLGYWVAG